MTTARDLVLMVVLVGLVILAFSAPLAKLHSDIQDLEQRIEMLEPTATPEWLP